MRLGIMQPYFFPYLGYFDLINCTDRWIAFDTVQHIRHGWINRNRVLHPQEGWQYIIVPLRKHSRAAAIQDVRIDENQNWQQRVIGQLQHYKKRAPFFDETIALVDRCLASGERSISRLNAFCLERVCDYLGVGLDYSFFSEMELDLGPIEGPGDWALRISEGLGAEEYVNPPGGAHLFKETASTASGIKVTIRNLPVFEYECRGYEFIPNLSIIDVLMWNEPEKIKAHLDKHRHDA